MNPPVDTILEILRKRYFEIAKRENYPNAPEITKELDELEAAIRAHVVTIAQ